MLPTLLPANMALNPITMRSKMIQSDDVDAIFICSYWSGP